MMDNNRIVQAIDEEIARLQQARELLSSNSPNTGKRKRGRPAKATSNAVAEPRKKRQLSPAGRKRIADAMKARWAARKQAGAPNAKKATRKSQSASA